MLRPGSSPFTYTQRVYNAMVTIQWPSGTVSMVTLVRQGVSIDYSNPSMNQQYLLAVSDSLVVQGSWSDPIYFMVVHYPL